MGSKSSGCYVIDSEYNIINVNKTAMEMYPQLVVGKKCYACLMGLDKPCEVCPVANNVKGPKTYTDPIRNISEIVDAVDIQIEGRGACHMLILSTVDSESDVYAKALPMTAEELRSLELIKSLTADYYDVFSVNINDGGMIIYRLNGKALGPDSVYRGTISYTEGMDNYIEKYVHPEDREMMYEACRLSEIKRTLSTMESIVLHYRVILDGEIHYYYRKMVRIGEADTYEKYCHRYWL